MTKHPHANVITTLGGRANLRKLYPGLTRQRIHYWETKGIPDAWRFRLSDYAKKAGIALPKGFRP